MACWKTADIPGAEATKITIPSQLVEINADRGRDDCKLGNGINKLDVRIKSETGERFLGLVRHSHWNGKLYTPRTDAGIREVDIHSSLASLLSEHIGTRTTGFVFQSSRGTPLARSNILRRSLHKILQEMGCRKSGFHGFRRYRINHLRNERVPEVLLRIWVGHATHCITDRYTVDALKRDTKLRRETAEQVGLGFHMPMWKPNCQLHPAH